MYSRIVLGKFVYRYSIINTVMFAGKMNIGANKVPIFSGLIDGYR